MNVKKFLEIMSFPRLWMDLDMYPEELQKTQVPLYVEGHEASSEHDRNGAFHWWLKRAPDIGTLYKLAELSFADPDQLMAHDVRRHIKESPNSNVELIEYIEEKERAVL
jgi:hypothetical protein